MSDSRSDGSRWLPLLLLATARRLPRVLLGVGPGGTWVLAGLCASSIGAYFWFGEGGLYDTIFATAATLAIGAGVVFLSRRVLVAAVLMLALVAIVRTVSYARQQASEVLLHAWDVVTFFTSQPVAATVWNDHRQLALAIAAALVGTALAAWAAYRVDAARVPRLYAAAALALLAALAVAANTARGERRHTEYYFEFAYVTFFYASWAETAEALLRGTLIQAAQPTRAQMPPLRAPAACTPAGRLPHIILIHQESVVPPEYFPTLSYDRSIDPFFRSHDGRLNRLRVETYGGASWLTEFSLLTGLSTQAFGGMRQFLQHVMAGKVADTLPQALARCGYRNTFFYPMLKGFLGSARFFDAVGLSEVFDAKAQGATRANERDRFYYANALGEIGHHVYASRQPLFVYLQTMAAHGPYDYTYAPEANVAGGGPGTHPEMSEYLRRLGMARVDYAFLRTELARRFPREQFLIVHYGDHQPTATQSLLGFGEQASIEDVVASGNDAARMTYYALDGVRYRPPPLPSLDTLDIPYLGTVILEAAGVPLSDAYRERRRLMMLCNGRYHDCPAREEILRFHRRLIDSGLLKAK
jgi:hypothetical protein